MTLEVLPLTVEEGLHHDYRTVGLGSHSCSAMGEVVSRREPEVVIDFRDGGCHPSHL